MFSEPYLGQGWTTNQTISYIYDQKWRINSDIPHLNRSPVIVLWVRNNYSKKLKLQSSLSNFWKNAIYECRLPYCIEFVQRYVDKNQTQYAGNKWNSPKKKQMN